jgi:hypothetical protein
MFIILTTFDVIASHSLAMKVPLSWRNFILVAGKKQHNSIFAIILKDIIYEAEL